MPDPLIERCDEPLETSGIASLEATLAHIMKPLMSQTSTKLTYDITNCANIDPGAVLLICYAIELSETFGTHVNIAGQGETMSELVAHFQNYWGVRTGTSAQPQYKGLYPMRSIKDKTTMLSELEEWARTVRHGTSATDEQVALWQMQIAEVTTNAFQHGPMHKSIARPSLVAGKAAGECVQLAALDFGSTIPRVISAVATQHEIPQDDGRLIQFACQKSITSQSVKQNQGAGLYSLVQTVNESKGSLQILSRNGLAYFCSDKEYCRELPEWPNGTPAMDGTLTIVNLRI